MLWFFSRVIVDVSPRPVTRPISGSWPLPGLKVSKFRQTQGCEDGLRIFFYGLDSFRCFGLLIMKEVSSHFSFLST